MKKPSACAPQAEGLKYYHKREVRETADSESLEDSRGRAEGSLTECSHTVTGLFKLMNLFIYFILFSTRCQDLSKPHLLMNVIGLKFRFKIFIFKIAILS